LETSKKVPKQTKKHESPERKKRQADYMKKHGKNEPSRKTLSVKNSYKKEVEGLK
jgi:DNA-dependent RNA polymerase auxiliary subunit epsilon